MNRGLVSVVMPTYNSLSTLGEAVSSVLGQNYASVELIMVDDASTDGTQGYLRDHGLLGRLKYLRNESRQGAPAARNRGKAAASGEFILFSDSDAVLRPSLVSRFVDVLAANQDASFAYSDFDIRLLDKSFRGTEFRSRVFDAQLLRQGNYIDTVSLVRAADCPEWDPDIRSLQDWDLWLTLLDAGKVGVHVAEKMFETIDRRESITRGWSRNNYSQALADVKSKHQSVGVIAFDGPGAVEWRPDGLSSGGARVLGGNLSLDHDYALIMQSSFAPSSTGWLREMLRVAVFCQDSIAMGCRMTAAAQPGARGRKLTCTVLGHRLEIQEQLDSPAVLIPVRAVESMISDRPRDWESALSIVNQCARQREFVALEMQVD